MLAEYIVPLTIALAVAAVVFVIGAIVTWRRVSVVGNELAGLAVELDEAAETLPRRLAAARASLAEQGAAAEHTVWTLKRIDEQMEQLTAGLVRRRASLDELRHTLEGARVGMERLKSAIRLIVRAIELRRAILG